MQRRHPKHLPAVWLMTDERQGDGLWGALARLPRGAGVLFRHCDLSDGERRTLFAAVRKIARARRLVLLFGARARHSRRVRADGSHGSHAALLRTASVHSVREIVAAERAGAGLLFLSPVYVTRSHPGARTLGPVRFGLLARSARTPIVALGGMTPRRARGLAPLGAYGWAAIDALTPRT